MKTTIQRTLAIIRGLLRPSRKCQMTGEFLSTKSHRGLGQEELGKFIYW